MLENKLDASNEKLDQMMSFVNTIIKNQSSLSSLTLEMDTRSEQNQERILGQIQQTYIQNTEILQKLYKENTSFFVRKCDLIVQKLTERDLTLDELALEFKQKKQGLLRYLTKLEEEGVIEAYSVETGKRGRPAKRYKLLNKE